MFFRMHFFLFVLLCAFFPLLADNNITHKAIIHTHEGEIEFLLDHRKTPNAVEQFIDFSTRGLYNQTLFSTLVQGFFTKLQEQKSLESIALQKKLKTDSSANTASQIIPAGIIAMIPLNGGFVGYQFYITHTEQNINLVNATIFGKIINGFDVLARLEKDDPILYIEILST